MIFAWSELCEDTSVVLFDDAFLKLRGCIWAMVLVKDDFVLEMTMDWCKNTYNCWLRQSEVHLVTHVMPGMINTESLLIVKVFLLTFWSL